MALREYRCRCGEVCYLFDNEDKDGDGHVWLQMPPRFTTVLATNMLMLEEPQLDSLISVYELDRQLTIEAREQKEMELFQEVRRNV